MSDARYALRAWTSADEAVCGQWRNQAGLPPAAPAPDEQALVLCDVDGRPQACARLRPHLGLDIPRYSFHIGRAVHAAAELGLYHCQDTLLLGNDHTGEAELVDLAHAPDCPQPQQALSALLEALLKPWLAEPANRERQLVVELAGWRRADGRSPFWDGLGRFFYPADPTPQRARWGEAWPAHLAALMPRQTLYLSFLAEPARQALGRAPECAGPALQALASQGFAYSRHVRIDDGGPIWVLQASTRQV